MGPGGRGEEEANVGDFDKSDVKGAVEVPTKPFCVCVCVCVCMCVCAIGNIFFDIVNLRPQYSGLPKR
jgi:hypothetical protein